MLASPRWPRTRPVLPVRGRRENLLYRPASLEAISDRPAIYPRFCRPIGDNHSASIVSQPDVAPVVRILLGSSRPSAITRLVVTCIVDAVDAVLRRWAWPHMLEERLERRAPQIANTDSPPAVVLEADSAGVRAALDDAAPHAVLGESREAVAKVPGLRPLPLQAAARDSVAGLQIRCLNRTLSPAIAAYKNRAIALQPGRLPQHEQSADSHPGLERAKLPGHRSHSYGVAPPAVTAARGFSVVRGLLARRNYTVWAKTKTGIDAGVFWDGEQAIPFRRVH